MHIPKNKNLMGLDMVATGRRISEMISASGLNDSQLGGMMGLSVQAINKWRLGRNLPDIENMFILSRILGKQVDDFLVPREEAKNEIEIEAGSIPASILRRLLEYVK